MPRKTIDVREALESGEKLPDEAGDVWAEPKRHKYYILRGRDVVPVPMLEWALWLETNCVERQVGLDFVGDHRVSTVFLGLDHNFCDDESPLIFETMIFADGNWDGEDCWRCSTYEEAEKQHQEPTCDLRPSTGLMES